RAEAATALPPLLAIPRRRLHAAHPAFKKGGGEGGRVRMKEPLLGSMAMPGKSLQKACRLLVVFCALHLLVTLLYYLSGRDFDVLQLFSKHQQSQEGRSSVPVTMTEVARESLAVSAATGLEKPAGDQAAAPPEEATETTETGPPSKVQLLPSCPDPSPLLGKRLSPPRPLPASSSSSSSFWPPPVASPWA
ncbi:beta-1,4-galactosyltransferase 1-like, partial [Gracilinanus agilis]|uniref:beta-1,4-galactosyltransferase 1-like n=1 Tax=Gracilinanus agilis TaxID=191870 RepID=UPI001CFF111C